MATSKPTVPIVRLAMVAGRPIIMWCRDERGRKIRKTTGTHDPAIAEQKRREWEARLVLDLSETETGKVASPSMPWTDFVEAYRLQCARKMRPKSMEDVESRLALATAIIKPRSLQDMVSRLDELQDGLLAGRGRRRYPDRPRATATVRSHMRSVIAALNWAAKSPREWLLKVPKIDLVSMEEKDDMKGRPLIGEEVDRVFLAVEKVVGAKAAPSWEFFLRGILASGLRLNELLNVSWDTPQTIQPIWRNARLPVLYFPAHLQKNKRTQEIPLCPWFEDLLSETPVADRHGWIFNPMSLQYLEGRSYKGRLTSNQVGRIVSRIGKRAGIVVDQGNPRTGSASKYASCHDLRRTFATRLYESDLRPELIRKLMRHADIRTTERFYLVTNTQKDAQRIRDVLANVPFVAPERVTNCDLDRDPTDSERTQDGEETPRRSR